MSEHTKGPWTIENDGDGDYVMAGKVEIYNPTEIKDYHESNANARLIAAALPMYEICECLAERDCEYPGSAGCDMLPQGVKRSVCLPCKARSIIAGP